MSIGVSPNPVSANSQANFILQIQPQSPPYSFMWTGLPSGCSLPGSSSQNNPSFSCSPNQGGSFNVQVTVTNKTGAIASNSTSFTVNSNNNGNNNNNNGNGNHNGNGSNSSGLGFLSGLGAMFQYIFIGAILVFVLLVLTAVSSLASAVLLARRLPARGHEARAAPSVVCPACGAMAPTGSKFCNSCGKAV
ncbi:MAG: PKD domain-containing protein [Candidatus Lutacidiplasmatales archaeon]